MKKESLDISQHEAGVDCHHHLVLHLTYILRQGIHRSPDLPGHGDSILGIRQAVGAIDALALLYITVVNHTRLDDIYQVNDGQAGLVGLDKHILPYFMSKDLILTLSWKCLIDTSFPPSLSLMLAQLMISLSTMGVPSVFSCDKRERV